MKKQKFDYFQNLAFLFFYYYTNFAFLPNIWFMFFDYSSVSPIWLLYNKDLHSYNGVTLIMKKYWQSRRIHYNLVLMLLNLDHINAGD